MLGLAACGGGGSGGSATTGGGGAASQGAGGAGGGAATSSGIACTGAPASPSLGGTWAALGRLAVNLQGVPGGAITICPEGQVGESTMILVLSVTEDPSDASKLTDVKAVLCSIELPVVTALVGTCDPASDALVTTQIIAPKSLLDALPGVPTAPVKGSTSGSAVSIDRFTVTVGSTKPGDGMPSWKLDDPSCGSDSVGRSSTCESTCVTDCGSMRDDDADGYPGVTVEVCGYTKDDQAHGVKCNADKPGDPGSILQGRGFIDLQVNPEFKGTATSSCEIKGTVDSAVDYHLVGADVVLSTAPIAVGSAIRSLPTFQVDPQKSKFRMVRVDGKYGAPAWGVDFSKPAAACAAALAHANEL
jgi:hypothetical protein